MFYFKVENNELYLCPQKTSPQSSVKLSTKITNMYDGICPAINSLLSSVHWIISDYIRDSAVVDIDNHFIISNLINSNLYNEHGHIVINRKEIKQYILKEICNVIAIRTSINVIFLRDIFTKKKFNKNWIYLNAKYTKDSIYENKTNVHDKIKKDKNRLHLKRKLLFDTKFEYRPKFTRIIDIRFESKSEYVLWKLGQKCASDLEVTKLEEIQEKLNDAKIIYSGFNKAFK